MVYHPIPKCCHAWLTVSFFVLCPVLLSLFIPAAEGSNQTDGRTLLVGIYPTAPFVIIDGRNSSGFSIDLWRLIAGDLDMDYRFVASATIAGALEDITEDRVDVALGALSITLLREQLADFTHPYFHTGLGIMVEKKKVWSLAGLAKSVLPRHKIMILGVLLLAITVAGHIIWFVERRYDTDQPSFDKRYFPGVLEGMYWAIVTASTVGYGDKVAKSWVGRLLVILLIICTLPLFAYSTARLASDITLREIRTGITGPRDLIERRVGVQAGSTGQEYVKNIGSIVLSFDQIETAYEWLRKGHLDAVVHDRPSLLYYTERNKRGDLEVLASTFSPQDYGIALHEDSPLREKLNRELLRIIEDGRLNEIHAKWFGNQL